MVQIVLYMVAGNSTCKSNGDGNLIDDGDNCYDGKLIMVTVIEGGKVYSRSQQQER